MERPQQTITPEKGKEIKRQLAHTARRVHRFYTAGTIRNKEGIISQETLEPKIVYRINQTLSKTLKGSGAVFILDFTNSQSDQPKIHALTKNGYIKYDTDELFPVTSFITGKISASIIRDGNQQRFNLIIRKSKPQKAIFENNLSDLENSHKRIAIAVWNNQTPAVQKGLLLLLDFAFANESENPSWLVNQSMLAPSREKAA